jgi:hypothetical protein
MAWKKKKKNYTNRGRTCQKTGIKQQAKMTSVASSPHQPHLRGWAPFWNKGVAASKASYTLSPDSFWSTFTNR